MKAAGVLLVLLLSGPQASTERPAPGSMPIPVSVAELAAAAGIQRADPSTLPIDMVRLLYASPDEASNQPAARRAPVLRVLQKGGRFGDRLPLPLSPATWRARVVDTADVPDDRFAAAIFSHRATALLYYGLLALDPPTLAWIDANPGVLETFQKHPGLTAAFARSIRVKDGAIVTPGDNANDVWEAIVGAGAHDPQAFIARLITSRRGRVAAFYDAVSHLDAAHQRFALGLAGDVNRIDRVRRLIDVATSDASTSRLEAYPFVRPDVDVSLLFRRLALDARGVPVGPSKRVWASVFGEATDGGDGPVDATWLAAAVLKPDGTTSRRRLDTLFFAQRALASDTAADMATLVAALQAFPRYPALMLVLESNGIRSAGAYAAAGRAAAALGGDEDALALFQGALAIVDRARQAGTIGPAESQRLIGSLMQAATTYQPRAALVVWLRFDLPSHWGTETATLLNALAGPGLERQTLLDWEGQQYSVDLAQPELRRLTLIGRSQQEAPLAEALATATGSRVSSLVNSLKALVYAMAMGEPDSQASSGGQVWRRHRFAVANSGDGSSAWRLATEEFGGRGWHLTGSLLRLDLALAHLALRRLDATEMPPESTISTVDRQMLARSIVLIDPRAIGDEARDAAAAAIARGRARVAGLAARPDALAAIAAEAPLSEWRLAGIRWLLVNDPARVPGSFTLLELFRLGGGPALHGWGAAADALDGCFCLRMPDPAPWEEYMGRPSRGQLATQLPDVMLRTAEALAARRLPATLLRSVAAFAMQDVIDFGRPAYFDDLLSLAFAARDLKDDRFDDYVAALTASGPLVPVRKDVPK